MNTHPERSRLQEWDDLSEADREPLLEHLRRCGDCRRVLIAERPESLFALLALQPIPADALDRVSNGVATAIDRPVRSRRFGGLAALAASLLLAAIGGVWMLRDETPAVVAVAEPEPRPAATAAAPLLPVANEPVRGLELISTPGQAEVVDFAIGDAQVVMIFNKDFDI